MVLASLPCATWTQAQVPVRPLDPCPSVLDVRPADLHGLWHFSLWPEGGSEEAPASRGAMLLERHPEFPDSARGQLRRSTPRGETQAQVSGDVSEGTFNLDESEDGVAMSAVWTGTLSPTDCRLDIQGTRRSAEGRPATDGEQLFRLRKRPEPRERPAPAGQ
jgi:hypothetical protein